MNNTTCEICNSLIEEGDIHPDLTESEIGIIRIHLHKLHTDDFGNKEDVDLEFQRRFNCDIKLRGFFSDSDSE